jgi:hypothetical protein
MFRHVSASFVIKARHSFVLKHLGQSISALPLDFGIGQTVVMSVILDSFGSKADVARIADYSM